MALRATDEARGREFHVAGVVVYTAPRAEDRVATGIAGMPGAAVHARADGKLVVTFEGGTPGEVAARIDEVRRLDGVAAAALVYQHGEEEPGDSVPCAREGGVDERYA